VRDKPTAANSSALSADAGAEAAANSSFCKRHFNNYKYLSSWKSDC
jgi:hypothetical protein